MNNLEILPGCRRVNSSSSALFVPELCLSLAQISLDWIRTHHEVFVKVLPDHGRLSSLSADRAAKC